MSRNTKELVVIAIAVVALGIVFVVLGMMSWSTR